MSSAEAAPDGSLRIALLGSPNTGKTTLFNALTDASAKVGNYPGVTVERREGRVNRIARAARLLDLPGTYSLPGETPEEHVVDQAIAGSLTGEEPLDAQLILVDATTLRRGLGLVRQVLERSHDCPTAVVVSMIDEARARGANIDFAKLSHHLGVSVFPIVGNRGVGLDAIRRAVESPETWPSPTSTQLPAVDAQARFAWVDLVCEDIGASQLAPDRISDRIDRVLLHPVSGSLVFMAVMVLLFQSIFTWAVPAMDLIDTSFTQLGALARDVLPAGFIADLIADGIVAGVGSVVIFLPQIIILFTLIHLLEDLGYMARAAFVVDRIMGWAGLQGRSFVVLLSCYACAVPGIMAARTIGSPRDRLATILVAPFMTCSARLPVYTLFIAAFIPAEKVWGGLGIQGLVMLGLYALGVITAFASAALLNSTVLRGSISRFYMELPPYRLPTVKLLGRQVWGSAWAFVRRAGTIIFAASIVVWVLLNFPKPPSDPALSESQQAQAALEISYGARLGKLIEPAIEPLGFDWRIGVGLVSSLAAREVIVSTLAQIYAVADADDFVGLRAALMNDRNPETGAPTFTLPTVLSLLVFFVFALQCVSTIAIMARETGSWRWPTFAFSYMLGLAYAGSFVTYRLANALL